MLTLLKNATSKHISVPYLVLNCAQMENVDRTVRRYTPMVVLPPDLFFVLKEGVYNTMLNVLISDVNLSNLTFVRILHVPKTLLTV